MSGAFPFLGFWSSFGSGGRIARFGTRSHLSPGFNRARWFAFLGSGGHTVTRFGSYGASKKWALEIFRFSCFLWNRLDHGGSYRVDNGGTKERRKWRSSHCSLSGPSSHSSARYHVEIKLMSVPRKASLRELAWLVKKNKVVDGETRGQKSWMNTLLESSHLVSDAPLLFQLGNALLLSSVIQEGHFLIIQRSELIFWNNVNHPHPSRMWHQSKPTSLRDRTIHGSR